VIEILNRLLFDRVITMATVTIEVPDEAFSALHRSPQELGREMRLAAAMIWYTQGRISHEKAASFAGVGRIDFIDALAASKLPAFHVDVDELMEEVELAHQAHREHLTAGLSRPSRSPGDPSGGSR
jgi:predicted HTH domain antitoxin